MNTKFIIALSILSSTTFTAPALPVEISQFLPTPETYHPSSFRKDEYLVIDENGNKR